MTPGISNGTCVHIYGIANRHQWTLAHNMCHNRNDRSQRPSFWSQILQLRVSVITLQNFKILLRFLFQFKLLIYLVAALRSALYLAQEEGETKTMPCTLALPSMIFPFSNGVPSVHFAF